MVAEKEFTIVQLVEINSTGDSYYRMRWPGRDLAGQNPQLRVINLDASSQERYRFGLEADLLVIYQSHDLTLLPVIHGRKQAGRKTIAEYNDNFYAPPPASPIVKEWRSPLIWQRYEILMNEADALVVTGDELKRLFQGDNRPDIHPLENFLPFTPRQFEETVNKPENAVNIGWGGSLGHITDVLAAQPLFIKLLDEFPETLLHIMGNESLPKSLFIHPRRLRFTEWGTMEQYFRFWEPVHIGLILALDTPYNRCRSDVKALEMTACGVLPLIPDLPPYRHFLKKTGLEPYKDFQDLFEKTAAYIRSPEKRLADLKRCHEYVTSERVGKENTKRLKLYESLLPETPNGVSWPVPPGYHEISGTPQKQLADQEVLDRARKLLAEKKPKEALDQLHGLLRQIPNHPDLRLQEASILRAVDRLTDELLEPNLKAFPNDARFLLLRTMLSKDPKTLGGRWQEVLAFLANKDEAFREYFRQDIINLLLKQMSTAAELIPVLESLAEIFPDSPELQYALAELCVQRGNDEEAKSLFELLHKQTRAFQRSRSFLEQTSADYFEAWAIGLGNRPQFTEQEKQDEEPKVKRPTRSRSKRKSSSKRGSSSRRKKQTAKSGRPRKK